MTTAPNHLMGSTVGDRDLPQRIDRNHNATRRFRPISMQLVAYLDGRYIELRFLTDDGESIAVSCPGNSIFVLQQHIEQIGRQCPEILGWNQTAESQTASFDVTSTSIAGW